MLYAVHITRSSAVAVIADRTACSILTLFIVSTSPPLKKNPFAVSPLIQLTITADLRPQIRNPHTSLHVHCSRHSAVSAHAWAVAPNGTVPTRSPRNCLLGLRCASFFVVHFVAKRYILQQKCQKGRIGTLMLGARWNNF